MSEFVLDSSVVLAVLRQEPGQDTAARYVVGASMSSVNLAEIIAKCIERDLPPQAAIDYVNGSNIRVLDFDFRLATQAGFLRRHAPKGVLSLGDRACIATAIRQGGTAVTADRIWATLDLGCPVELIR